MCGIFGTTRSLSDQQAQQTLALLHHRGPDSQGAEALRLRGGGCLTLQHTRLAIQDLSANGHQPMRSRCGRWVVVFNGEIYNHHELRKGLDVVFRGGSDTETLVEVIAAYGVDATLARLNGIFGLAAFDSRDEVLYLVRDPYGVKPVYYHHDDGDGLSFASEIAPLLVDTTAGIDPDALSTFLTLRYTPSPQTLIAGVRRLAPGHLLEYRFDSGPPRTRRYISPTVERFSGGLDEAVESYHKHLAAAVERQLIADVPVGILLSGGIDSALLASLVSGRAGMTGYTVGFTGAHADCEIDDARETAAVLGIAHRVVRIDPEHMLDDLPAIIEAVEEPLGTTSIMAMWPLVQLAREDVTVALAGQGSDEPWGGYRRYKIEHLLGHLPWLQRRAFAPLGSWLATRSANEAIARGAACLGMRDLAQRFCRAYALFDEPTRRALSGGDGAELAESVVRYWLDWLPSARMRPAEAMMRIDTRLNLADDLLLYGDKISMAFALELRVPMLDLELMRFVESLPLAYRSTLRRTKIVHKLAAERYLPARIVHRRKKGFQVPFGSWSRGIWRRPVEDMLLDGGNPIYSALDRGSVESLWRQHLSGRRDLSRQIFALLTLALWARRWLGSRPSI